MVKNNRNKPSKNSHASNEEQKPRKKLKKDVKPQMDEHLEQIPFRLRAIMKSKEKMNQGSSKLKKITRAHKHKAPEETFDQIRVPHFRRGKQESERAYLQRMSQETQHVLFLTNNQSERCPELHVEEKPATSNKESKKKRLQTARKLHKKEVKQMDLIEQNKFVDKVEFGEVAMAPPSLTVKPKKAPVKPQRTSSGLLLTSVLGYTDVSTAKPSMARQKILEEERKRVVHAYRHLKRQIQEAKEQQISRRNKFLNPH